MTALHLSLLPIDVAQALARGERIEVMVAGQKVGDLAPTRPPRQLGTMAGTVLATEAQIMAPTGECWEALEGRP